MTPIKKHQNEKDTYGRENYYADFIMPLDLRRDIDYIDPSRFYSSDAENE